GQMVLIDVNPKTVHDWRTKGFEAHLGDATNPETLIHAGIANADLFVVAVSDHESARLAVVGAKQVNPEIHVVARARYHRFAAAIDAAGATVVVDEERRVGEELAREALRCRQATL
ncbi:MAG: NAD-binding protein, partial [Nitrospirae bacterium]|nr:NAD-binding protein [Fimbriimonadaceae bacterium]